MEPVVTFSDLSKFENQIRICETYEDLSLFHYRNVDETSDPLLKQIRGIVFDKNGQLVMRGFPYTPEYVHDHPDLENIIGDTSRFKIIHSHEGTVLRVFCYNNKWFVSTHRKLFSSSSYWASNLSFESQFEAAINHWLAFDESPLKAKMKTANIQEYNYETFFQILDKNKQYMFLLLPYGENRIVSYFGSACPTVMHVGTFVNQRFTLSEDLGLMKPLEMQFESAKQLLQFVEQIKEPYFTQGLLLMHDTGFIKIVNKVYSALFQLRGNQPNIELRFCELLNQPEQLQSFMALYPEYHNLFKNLQQKVNALSRIIHNAYINRFIKKNLTFLPQAQFKFLMKVHQTYLETNIVTSQERIVNLLSLEPAIHIYNMIS